MLNVIAWRVVQFPLILAIIYLISFLFIWVAPGSPFGQSERKLNEVTERALKQKFHAESWQQFLAFYPYNIVRSGDFGPSMQYPEWSVNDILKSALPVSVTLGLFALSIAVVSGVAIGTLAAVHRGGIFDWASLTVALIGISMPSFIVAAVLLLFFAGMLGWFPIGGWGRLEDMVLPGIALSLAPMAYIARLTRVSMIDVLSSDFVRTARAKGVSRTVVIWKHCLRNAFLPVLSYLGPAAAATLTGSFVVEKVFSIPGLGTHFVNSIQNRDRTLILGTVMVYSLFLLSFNLLVDIGYSFVDPRIDLEKAD
ncbi:MAG: oligopeptide transport system permease protein [Humisphaera sp.]|nr:oligopeptide transport system permease protein [Humisphaera sp.]